MAFKKIESKIGFAELALSSSMDKNRTLKTLEQMNKVIDWPRIEKILKKYYKVGISAEGADAYPPLMLFKCLCFKNGSESLQTLNWKVKSTIEYLLKTF